MLDEERSGESTSGTIRMRRADDYPNNDGIMNSRVYFSRCQRKKSLSEMDWLEEEGKRGTENNRAVVVVDKPLIEHPKTHLFNHGADC